MSADAAARHADGEPVDGQVGLARGTFLGLRADVVDAVALVLVSVVIARALGPELRGVFFLAMLAATLLVLLIDLGLSTAAIAYSARRTVSPGELHGIAALFSLGAGCVAAAVLLPFQGFWTDTVLDGLDATLFVVVCVSVVPLLYGKVVAATLTGLGRIPAVAGMRVFLALATLVGITLAVVIEPTATAALLAWLVAVAIFAVGLGTFLWRYGGRPRLPTIATAQDVLGFGMRGWIGTLAHQGFLRIDVLILNARLGPATVGIYSLASVAAEKISLLGQAVYGASAAAMGGRPRDGAAALTVEIVRMLVTLMLPVAALAGIAAFPLFPLVFGEDFAGAALPFVMLLPGTVALTLWYVVSLFIVSSLHRPGTTTVIQASALMVSLPLYYFAIAAWGMAGAAAVSSFVYLSVLAMGLTVLFRSSGTRPAELLPRASDGHRLLTFARTTVLERAKG